MSAPLVARSRQSLTRTSCLIPRTSYLRRLRRDYGAGLEKLAKFRMVGIAGVVHRADPFEYALVEKGDAVADRECGVDVVRDHHRGHVQFRLQVDDHLVDGLRGDGIETGGR